MTASDSDVFSPGVLNPTAAPAGTGPAAPSDPNAWRAALGDLLDEAGGPDGARHLTAARAIGAESRLAGATLSDLLEAQMGALARRVAGTADSGTLITRATPLLLEVVEGFRSAGEFTGTVCRVTGYSACTHHTVNARFRQLCSAAPIPMYLMDADGVCLYINPQLAELLDVEPDACLGRKWTEMIAAPNQERVVAELREAYRSGRTFTREIPVRGPQGGTRWLSLNVAVLREGEADSGVRVGTVQDVTERRLAEEALRDSEMTFRTLAETVPAAIFIYRAARCVYVNGMMERMTGFSRAEILSRPIWNVIHPRMRDTAMRMAQARLAGQAVVSRYEVAILTKSGEERWVDYSASLIEYEGRRAVLGVAVDITARKTAEEEARRRQNELLHVARVSTLGKMASEMAHELNQPLAAIVNYASGCLRRIETDGLTPRDLTPALDEMRTEAQRAGEIIRRVLAFVRKQPAQHVLCDINTIVRDAAALALAATHRPAAEVEYALGVALPPVYVQQVQIMQVVVNLVRNALEAMSAAGVPRPHLTITTDATIANTVAVSVRDNGPGLDDVSPMQLFEPYFTTKADGLGLGLSISRTLIEAHGGELVVIPNQDQGVTFRFTLPAAEGSLSS